jgi:fumarylacetoacetase
VIAQGNELGNPIPVGAARDHIFGLCLVNDWSARDLQKWEYQPLGPVLAKNFGTTVSPFIVTLDALDPFRVGGFPRPASDPAPLAYLTDSADKQEGGFDIHLEISLQSRLMREQGISPVILCKGNAFSEMYWTFAQMIAHHTCNGCNFQPGDLIASGTVSGKGPAERGCLLESTWDGPGKPRVAIELPTQEKRTFLADGDRITFRGWCERAGFRRISLGECTGTIVPA